MNGKLIVIDGADGSGKATQAKLLMESLKNRGFNVEMLDYPRYGKESAYFVEQYLNGKYGSVNEVSPKLASLFYALDRFDSKQAIMGSLNNEKIVISNRYVSANAGHQGGKIKELKERNDFLDWLNELEYEICGLPKPDIKIYLHVPSTIGQKLVDKKGHRDYIGGTKRDIHEADLNHLTNTEEAYLYLTKKEGDWITINCMDNDKLLSIDEIHKKIVEKIRELI